jgi:hypothetical protein
MRRWIVRKLLLPLRKHLKAQRAGTNGLGADGKRDHVPELAAIGVCGHRQHGLGGVQFSGLAAGFVGLWQVNLTIPPGTPADSAVPVRVVINGTPNNTVTVGVR